jgi:CRP-like cAMP-binding protein
MAIEDEIALLERVPTLRRLGGAALRNLAIAAESLSLKAGDVLFTAGDDADGAFVVQRGSLALRPQAGGDEEVSIAGPATLLGETALLAATKRPATATAREPARVLRISRAAFLKILDSYPEAAQRLRELLTSRADQWGREMENIRTALARGRSPQ